MNLSDLESTNFEEVEFKDGHLILQRKTIDSKYCRLNKCEFEPKPPNDQQKTYPWINVFRETDHELRIPFEEPDKRTQFHIICTGKHLEKQVELHYQSSRTIKISIF